MLISLVEMLTSSLWQNMGVKTFSRRDRTCSYASNKHLMVCSFTTSVYWPSATGKSNKNEALLTAHTAVKAMWATGFVTYCCVFPPLWKGRSGFCRCSHPSSRSRRSFLVLREASSSVSQTAPGTGSYHWIPLWSESQTHQLHYVGTFKDISLCYPEVTLQSVSILDDFIESIYDTAGAIWRISCFQVFQKPQNHN